MRRPAPRCVDSLGGRVRPAGLDDRILHKASGGAYGAFQIFFDYQDYPLKKR